MLLKKILSLSMLFALAGSAFVASSQDAEANRCCRQRCHRRCCNTSGGYVMNGGYGYSNSGSCNSCNATGTSVPTTYDGNTAAPAPSPAPAPPPAPTT
jgi:hypothetical protein